MFGVRNENVRQRLRRRLAETSGVVSTVVGLSDGSIFVSQNSIGNDADHEASPQFAHVGDSAIVSTPQGMQVFMSCLLSRDRRLEIEDCRYEPIELFAFHNDFGESRTQFGFFANGFRMLAWNA